MHLLLFVVLWSYVVPLLSCLVQFVIKILSNVNMVVQGQVKSENSSLSVTVCCSKMCVLVPYCMWKCFIDVTGRQLGFTAK